MLSPDGGAADAADESVLEIDGLKTHFFTPDGVVRAVDGVSCEVRRGETLGVVGESGCGKSVTALSILRLVADPPGRIVAGSIRFEGRDLLAASEAEMEGLRGNDIEALHVIAPAAMPFADTATTGAITCFRAGRQGRGIRFRTETCS